MRHPMRGWHWVLAAVRSGGRSPLRTRNAKGPEAATCGNHGTQRPVREIALRRRHAGAKEEKLVMVLHISGHLRRSASSPETTLKRSV